jgi:hypothetical protein
MTTKVPAARRVSRAASAAPAVPPGVTRDDLAFARAFARGALPSGDFSHRGHLRVAWVYLRQRPFARAALCFGRHLRRYAGSLGAAGKYHETLTWAYLVLINERLQAAPPGESFEGFLERCPELADPKGGLIGRYYDKAQLASPSARQAFVLPRVGVGGRKHPVKRRLKPAPRWGRAPFIPVRPTREPSPNEGWVLTSLPCCHRAEHLEFTAPDFSRGFRDRP